MERKLARLFTRRFSERNFSTMRRLNMRTICLLTFLVVSMISIIYFYFKQVSAPLKMYYFSCDDYATENRVLSETLDGNSDYKVCSSRPSILMEQTRRHISESSHYQWIFMRNQIKILQRALANSKSRENYAKYENTLEYMLQHGSEYSKVIDLEVKKLQRFDGWDKWRRKEDQELRKTIRKRITDLQNPRNCNDVPVLVCNLKNPAGFASGLHDVLWCFINAYSSHQRMVLETSHWHYAPDGWETLFRPLSETCHDDQENLRKVSRWPGPNGSNVRTLLRTIPEDLGIRIIRLQGNPLAWWYGQFIGYLMRPNNELQNFINAELKRIKFSKGIVGLHVRRTDKIGTEAANHELDEYMEQAEEYFQGIELVLKQNVKRRVYIATDEPHVLKECAKKYPQYDCLFNEETAKLASDMSTRDSKQSLWGLMVDIFALSQTDFIVCTMSSGVCRLAYELKLSMHGDAVDVSDKVSSLDIPHYYAWTTPTTRKAIYNHNSKSIKEISFEKDDLFYEVGLLGTAIEGKAVDGFMKMWNTNKSKEGFFPIYKTSEIFVLTNMT